MNYWNNTSQNKKKKAKYNSKSYKPTSFMNGISKNQLTKIKRNITSQSKFPNIPKKGTMIKYLLLNQFI